MQIYLDNAASTRPLPAVTRLAAELESRFYANDSAAHRMGVEASRKTEEARAALAGLLGAEPDEIVFTSGGTEANNLALLGAWTARRKGADRLVISAVEHSSVFNAAMRLKREGAEVAIVRPGPGGLVDPAELARAAGRKAFLVSVIHASNETGAVQPVADLAAACRASGALFHTDACQSFTKLPLSAAGRGPDLITVNAHKLHGPKGVGALYIRKGARLRPLAEGGGHERGLRPGTRNTPGIAAFALAARLSAGAGTARLLALDKLFRYELSRALPSARLNCPAAPRLPGLLSVTLPGIASASAAVRALSDRGVFVSAGSACSAGSTAPSRALLGFGLRGEEARRTLRVSFGRFNTRPEVLAAVRELASYAGKYGA